MENADYLDANLKQERKIIHKYHCEICEYKTTNSKIFNKHLAKHTSGENCPFCEHGGNKFNHNFLRFL